MGVPKRERREEFSRRLAEAPPASTYDEMFTQMCNILNDVEDRMDLHPLRSVGVADGWADVSSAARQRQRRGWLPAADGIAHAQEYDLHRRQRIDRDPQVHRRDRFSKGRRRRPWRVGSGLSRAAAGRKLSGDRMSTNDLEHLRKRLEQRFPTAHFEVKKPRTQTGSWWLDLTLDGYELTIEWRPGKGFGLSTPAEGDFGLGPDEVYRDVASAFDRAKALLLSQTATIPPAHLTLPQLREDCKLSQVELAQRLQINQGAVSRLERRRDMRIQTLRRLVSAMGGELELLARFPDHTVQIQLDELLGSEEARA